MVTSMIAYKRVIQGLSTSASSNTKHAASVLNGGGNTMELRIRLLSFSFDSFVGGAFWPP